MLLPLGITKPEKVVQFLSTEEWRELLAWRGPGLKFTVTSASVTAKPVSSTPVQSFVQ